MSKNSASTICCGGCNPWHHPYTFHSAWCPYYHTESIINQNKNEEFHNKGGFYTLGIPEDAIAWKKRIAQFVEEESEISSNQCTCHTPKRFCPIHYPKLEIRYGG